MNSVPELDSFVNDSFTVKSLVFLFAFSDAFRTSFLISSDINRLVMKL